MVLVVENPSRGALTPSPAPSGCSSSAHVESEVNHARPSTPKKMLHTLMSGRMSPFRVNPAGASGTGSGFLSRSSSCRSSSKESRSKRQSQVLDTDLILDTTIKSKSAVSSPFPPLLSPTFSQFESTLGSPMIVVQSLSSSDAQVLSPSGVTSPAEVSSGTSASTLSVETDDEDLISTRSPSPFEDMMDSQVTASTMTDAVVEDLPEALRLMRVAQRHGIKVLDFAFEGPKHEGQVEEWAWEGGAACKGFGMGFGGGAYNGVLKKYRPPPKEKEEQEDEEDEDAMILDRPITSDWNNSRAAAGPAHRPPPIFSGAKHNNVERPFNSPGLPRATPGVSGSDFLLYLEERRGNQPTSSMPGFPTPPLPPIFHSANTDVGFKRDRSFGSSEPSPDDRNPFKKRVLG